MERGDVGLVWSQAEGGGDGGCGRRGVGQPREFQPCPGRRRRAEPHAEGLVFGVMVAGRLLEKCAGDAVKHVVAVVVVQRGGRPGLSGGLVLELLRCRGAEREAHADGRQQRHVPRLAAGRCQDRPGAGLREERVQQHRPRVPRPERPLGRQRPGRRPPARRQAGTRLRLSVSPGLRLALSPGPGNGTGTGLGFRLGEQGLRRRPPGLAAWGRRLPARAQAAADRGIRHAEPPADLRVAGALLPPCPGLLPLRRGHLPRPAPAVLHGQGRRPVPLRRAVQCRDVRLRQAQRRGDRPAPEPQLPQHRQRDVPHHDVAGRVVEQDHRPGCDHAPAIVLVHAEVTGLWHALQDGRNRRWHATSLPLI